MDLQTYDRIFEDIIAEGLIDEIEIARDLITKDTVDAVARMYADAQDYPAPSPLIAAALACDGYDTLKVRLVGLHFLLTTPDDGTEPMRLARARILKLLAPGDLTDPELAYYESAELRAQAEATIRANTPEIPSVDDFRRPESELAQYNGSTLKLPKTHYVDQTTGHVRPVPQDEAVLRTVPKPEPS